MIDSTVAERLREARIACGFSGPNEAARAFGWNVNTYKSHENGIRGVPRDTITQYARAFRVAPEWLQFGKSGAAVDRPTVLSIPVIGYVGAGGEQISIDDHAQGGALDTIEIDFADADPIAVWVRGDSNMPVYRDGDALICSRMRGANIEDALNQDCMVKTADGVYYLKFLQRGRTKGRYTLRSYNMQYPDLENVDLEWAAPVVIIRRGRPGRASAA